VGGGKVASMSTGRRWLPEGVSCPGECQEYRKSSRGVWCAGRQLRVSLLRNETGSQVAVCIGLGVKKKR